MKSIFNEGDYKEIRNRIASLQETNQRQWGRMTIAQMLAHCSIGFEIATGKLPFEDKSNLILRTVVKRIVLILVKRGNLGRNQRTFSLYKIKNEREFEKERINLLESIDVFYTFGIRNEIGKHPYFGKLSKEEWGAMQYVHTDHHLKQFSA